MSLIAPRGDQSTADEVSMLTSLTGLGNGYIKVNKDWSGYTKRLKLTIDYTRVDNDTNFLLYIDLSALASNFWDYVQNGGGDIRVSASDGETEYARDVISCDTTARTGFVYVLIPSISKTANTDIYLYYGNSSASDYEDTDTYGRNAVYANSGKNLSSNTYKGGVLRVIDSATGDIAATSGQFIENEMYGWYLQRNFSAVSAEFDSAVTRTGKFTIKLSTTDVTGSADVRTSHETPTTNSRKLIALKPNTSYKLSVYVKTDNVESTNGIKVGVMEYNSNRVYITETLGTGLKGTNDWTLKETTFTTNASTAYGVIKLRNYAGNISDAWFDVNSMTLEEVSTITNPSSVPALLYPKATAVTSNNNIDQSQVSVPSSPSLGKVANPYVAQLFTPTKKNLTGVSFRKDSLIGSYTGNVTVSIRENSSGSPSATDLISYTIPNATFVAAPTTDYPVYFSSTLNLTIGSSYWIVLKSSTADDSNYANIKGNSSGTGKKSSANGTTWGAAGADIYFTTLYSKNTDNFTVRTDTQTLSVTAPTTDGWPDGTIIDTMLIPGITPLTLQPGVNNIYYSSNGPEAADLEGDTDPSLQCAITCVAYPENSNYTTEYETSGTNFKTLTAVDSGITKTEVGENKYDFGTSPTKLKMKDTDGNGYTYLTFFRGQIISSDSPTA